jgi:hypothetical protein
MDFTIDVAFPHPEGNQLGGLGTEIEDQYPFLAQMIEHILYFKST